MSVVTVTQTEIVVVTEAGPGGATLAALTAETAARVAADETLQGNIDTVSDALTAETAARVAADETLQGNIDALGWTAVTSNTTAVINGNYSVIASATFTDPAPVAGKGYTVRVRNGTATIGGTGYDEGTWWRVYHSGSWSTRRIGFSSASDADAFDAIKQDATDSYAGAVKIGGTDSDAAATVAQLSLKVDLASQENAAEHRADGVWFMSGWEGGDGAGQTKLTLYTSLDGIDWRLLCGGPVFAEASPYSIRDADVIFWRGKFYACYTANGLGSGVAYGIAVSDTLSGPWSRLALVDCSSALAGLTTVWAPQFFVEDGQRPYIHVALGSGAVGSNPRLHLMQATSDDLSTWSTPVIMSGIGTQTLDGSIVKVGATYNLFFVDKTSGTATEPINLATATSINGPWTIVQTGDWAGWGVGFEGPHVVALGDNKYRIYMDKLSERTLYYSDSSSGFTGWTLPAKVPYYILRHSTPKKTSDPHFVRSVLEISRAGQFEAPQVFASGAGDANAILFSAQGGSTTARADINLGDLDASDFTAVVDFDFPQLATAPSLGLFGISGSTTADAAEALRCWVEASGELVFDLVNSDNNGNLRATYGLTSLWWHFAGRRCRLSAVRRAGELEARLNGITLRRTSLSTQGTNPPASFGANVASRYLLWGNYNSVRGFVGRFYGAHLLNRALTLTEVESLCASGLSALDRNGSMTAVNATDMTQGRWYRIVSPGTTSFTSYGSANNSAGTDFFNVGGAATGTGTVLPLGALGSYQAREGRGIVVADASGNGKHSSLVGTAWAWARSQPTIRAYANDAAADADTTLASGEPYTITGSRALLVKP